MTLFIMQMINEQEVFETWAPVIEQKTGIKDTKKVDKKGKEDAKGKFPFKKEDKKVEKKK
jgi:hypothetical protein